MRAYSLAAAVIGLLCAASTPAQQPAAEPGQTRVTLNLEGVSAEEAMAELGKAGGIKFQCDNPAQWNTADLVILNVKDRPFWPTVIEVCRQAKINFDLNSYGRQNTRQVRVWPGQDLQIDHLPTCEAGGSLLMLQHAQRSYSLAYANPMAASCRLWIQATVLLDPKLRRASSNIVADVTTAVDENGLSLVPNPKDSANHYYGGEPGSLIAQTGINLAYPANAGRKIARLAGTLQVSAVTKETAWEIKDVLSAKPQMRDTAFGAITLKSFARKAQGDGYELKLAIRRKGRGDGNRFQNDHQVFWSLVQAIELQSADGGKFAFGGGSDNGNEWTVSFNPPVPQAKPTTLTWSVPVEIMEVTMPFEFKDLPIP